MTRGQSGYDFFFLSFQFLCCKYPIHFDSIFSCESNTLFNYSSRWKKKISHFFFLIIGNGFVSSFKEYIAHSSTRQVDGVLLNRKKKLKRNLCYWIYINSSYILTVLLDSISFFFFVVSTFCNWYHSVWISRFACFIWRILFEQMYCTI